MDCWTPPPVSDSAETRDGRGQELAFLSSSNGDADTADLESHLENH